MRRARSLQPVPVVAVRRGGTLTVGDVQALSALKAGLATVPGVSRVLDLGGSPGGRAGLLLAEAQVSGGMRAHLAGDLAGQVDSSAKGGSTAGSVLNIAALLIVILLIVIFRSLLAPLITLAPAFLAVTLVSGAVGLAARHGTPVSSMVQVLLIVLVLGAGTDYGLFLVFRARRACVAARGRLPALP